MLIFTTCKRKKSGTASYTGEKLWHWLWAAAVNRVRGMGRRAQIERREPSTVGSVALAGLAAPGLSPSSCARRSEEREHLSGMLRQLSPEDETAIRHGCLLELKGEELGQSLGGISASAAAHRKERALRRLASLLAESE